MAAPNVCTITGIVYAPSGDPLANGTIIFDSVKTQVIQGQQIARVVKSTTTDSQGVLAPITLTQMLAMQVTVCDHSGTCNPTYDVLIPVASSGDFTLISQGTNLIGTQIPPIGVTDGSDAAPGLVGEFFSHDGTTTVPAYPAGTGPGYTVATTLTLPPGDWDVYANFYTLISYGGGNVVGALAWWGFLGPSSIPLGSTDGTPPSATVAWIGGQYADAPLAEGGTIGPCRFSSATSGGMDIRLGIAGTSGSALISWAISARRMR